jgi:hypothetical protein
MARPATGQLIVNRGEADTTYAARFRAYGRRHYITLGYESEGMTRAKAKLEMQAILADRSARHLAAARGSARRRRTRGAAHVSRVRFSLGS